MTIKLALLSISKHKWQSFKMGAIKSTTYWENEWDVSRKKEAKVHSK